jgi:hypothetical protein
MFEATSHDFGTCARGAKTQYEFVLKNIYVEDIHIADVHSSCGCTTPSIKTPTLKTYEKGAIIATFNTHAFLGSRGATLTVTIDKPYYAQVQLHVTGYIRSDVVLTPGSVDMGTVDQGTPVEKTIAVSYSGRSDWAITGIQNTSPYLSASAVEASRNGGWVTYNLTVRTDGKAPAGLLDERLMLVTNDPQSGQVPVPIQGVVESGITVSPSSLFIGVVQPGQKITKQLVVRSKKPFRIISISCDGQGFEFDTSGEKTPKELHLIPVTFVAGAETGKITKQIRIETDQTDSTPILSAYAVVAGD